MNNQTKENYESDPINSFDEQDLTLKQIREWLIKNSLIISIVSAIFFVGSVIYSLNATKIFTAEIKILTVSEDTSSGLSSASGLAQLAGINLNLSTEVSKHNEYIAILKSHRFLSNFLNEEGIKDIIYPEFSSWKSVEKFLTKNFSESKHIKTGITTLSISWTNPEQASDWLNKLVDSLNQNILVRDMRDLNTRVENIKKQLTSINDKDQRKILFEIMGKLISDINLAESRKDYAIRIIDPAVPPEERSYPRRVRIVLFWSLMGLLSGILISLLLPAFNRANNK